MSALTAPIQVDGCNLKPGPHPNPLPEGEGISNDDYENLT